MPPVAVAFAAVAAGTATVMSVATVVGVIGAGTYAVGKVTGNEKLQKIGKVAALAGGAVALGAYALGGSMTSAAAGGAVGSAGAGTTAAEYAAGIGGGSSAAGSQAAMLAAQTGEFGTAGLTATTQAASTAGTGALSVPSIVNTASQVKGATGLIGSQRQQVQQQAQQPVKDKGWWDSLSSTDKLSLLKAGGETITGMVQGWSAEQKSDFEKERYNLMNQNANAQPSLQFQQVSGVTNRPVGGLLNSNRG